MIGDAQDCLARIKAALPTGWFPDVTPVLDGVLSGPAYGWAWSYSLIGYVKAQARRLTASGVFLDMTAADFFGGYLSRFVNESDAALSGRIGRELFREKGTRAGLIAALTDLTGRAPTVFEPGYTMDTGGYGVAGGMGYGIAGGYGSLALPFQFFVTAYRPHGGGIANSSGWRSLPVTSAAGGWGAGAIQYGSLAMIAGQVTDAAIYNAVNNVRPVASIAWTNISN